MKTWQTTGDDDDAMDDDDVNAMDGHDDDVDVYNEQMMIMGVFQIHIYPQQPHIARGRIWRTDSNYDYKSNLKSCYTSNARMLPNIRVQRK